jgi:hypothetical protein
VGEEAMNDIDLMILNGAVEVVGVDENGEFLYQFTEKMHELFPDFKSTLDELFLQEIDTLWLKGFIDMDIALTNPAVSLTSSAYDEAMISALPDRLRTALNHIKRVLENGL